MTPQGLKAGCFLLFFPEGEQEGFGLVFVGFWIGFVVVVLVGCGGFFVVVVCCFFFPHLVRCYV